MARNKRLSKKGNNRLFGAKAVRTKKLNKQTSMNTPGGIRL